MDVFAILLLHHVSAVRHAHLPGVDLHHACSLAKQLVRASRAHGHLRRALVYLPLYCICVAMRFRPARLNEKLRMHLHAVGTHGLYRDDRARGKL